MPTPQSGPKLSHVLTANLASRNASAVVSQENSAKAYSKLLEGQRHLWAASNGRGRRSPAVVQNGVRLARQAFVEAAESNPYLSEAYTALAELSISAPPSDIDEAISLAELATRIEKNNFGARRILARLYTFKSGIGSRALDSMNSQKAIEAWQYVAKIDPRNAEAWAFLAEFYERLDKPAERIGALEKWRSSAAPLDAQFFQRILGGRESLAPESATVKLGAALLKAGRVKEAIETLSIVVSDEPDNEAAIESLREAIEASTGDDSSAALQALQQAVFANSDSAILINLLAETYARSSRLDEAARVLNQAALKAAPADRALAAAFYVSLGDLFERSDKFADANASYEKAIAVRGLNDASTFADDERSFLNQVFEKMIRAAKNSDRPANAIKVIERSKKLFGPDDSFADRQLISHYREAGKRQEALAVVRKLRTKGADEESLARLEATLLTELGRVDEAVLGYRKHLSTRASTAQSTTTTPNSISVQPATDEFSNLLFVSQLYSQANRGKEAIGAANQAHAVARGAERKQIARLTIATAQQNSGDHAAAEATLREILRESPDNPIALNNLGYFLLERDIRFDEALKLIQKAVDTDPTNPSYLDSLGWAYYKLGKYAEAEKNLKAALRYDSMSATIHEHLGDVYLKQGKADLSRTAWQKALELASDGTDITRLKGKLATR